MLLPITPARKGTRRTQLALEDEKGCPNSREVRRKGEVDDGGATPRGWVALP
jgi:hypothetical protein